MRNSQGCNATHDKGIHGMLFAWLQAFLLAILGTTIRSGRMLRLASSVWSAAQPISLIWRLSLRIKMRWVDTLAGCPATMYLYLNNKRADGLVCG